MTDYKNGHDSLQLLLPRGGVFRSLSLKWVDFFVLLRSKDCGGNEAVWVLSLGPKKFCLHLLYLITLSHHAIKPRLASWITRNTWSTCSHASNSQQPQETEMFVHQTDELLGLQLSETPSRREIKITSFIFFFNFILFLNFT